MRSGICPKCSSATVHHRSVGSLDQLGTALTFATPDSYVCSTCGYFEQYLPQGKALERVTEKWPRVEPQG